MTNNNTLITLEVNKNILDLAECIFTDKGLSLNEAIEGFLDASVFCNDIPYDFVVQEPDFPPDEYMVAPDSEEPESDQAQDNELQDFVFDDVAIDDPITYIIKVVFDDDNAVWKANCDELPEFMLESGSFDALIERCKMMLPNLLAIREIPAYSTQIVFRAERQDIVNDF